MKLKPLRAAVLAALIPAFAAGCVDSIASQPTPATPAPVTQSARPGPDFTRLVEQAGPAVVNISVTEKPKAQEQSMDPDDPVFQFFRHFDIPLPKQPVRHARVKSSSEISRMPARSQVPTLNTTSSGGPSSESTRANVDLTWSVTVASHA